MEYDNSKRGVLFKNNDKRHEKSPDYTGSITLADGTEYWLSAWINTPKGGGEKYISLSIGDKKESRSKSQPMNNDFDDDIPF